MATMVEKAVMVMLSERGIVNVLDVKFAFGIKNINFDFLPLHVDRCVLYGTVYSILSQVRCQKSGMMDCTKCH